MTRAYLSLGRNLGDRLGYLRAAAEALGHGPDMRLVGASRVYETVPVEVEGDQPDYLNCVVLFECGLSVLELLRFCQGVEAALGREAKGRKAPRTVDIDVLLFGEEVVDTPELRVPHPGVARGFNLRGLADLDQGIYIPGRGTVGEALVGLELSGVRKLEGVSVC